MKRSMYLPLALIALAVLAGCASTPDYDWMAAEQARQARLDTVAAQCETDLCLVMVAQESNRNAIRPPQQGHHPAWSIFDRAIGLAVPAYFGWRQTEALTDAITGTAGVIAGMDRADYSTHIGGDQIGGDRVDDRSVGGDRIGGDRIDDRSTGRDRVGGDWRSGDDWQDVCVGDDCRFTSPGPIDNSDNSAGEP